MRKLLMALIAITALAATGAAGAKTVTVTITKNGYVPKSSTISVGDAVQFTNADTVAHQISFKSTAGVTCTTNPVVVQPAQSVTCTFQSAGTYSYSDPNVKGNTFRGSIVVVAPAGGSVTLQAKPQIVVYGAKATLSGTVSNHRPGENGQVLAQPCGAPSATPVSTVTTTTGGAFSALVQPLRNGIYTVKVKKSTSNAVSIKVRPRLRLRKLAAHRYSIRVLAAQSFAGKYAIFQRYRPALARWVKVRRVLLRANATGVAPTVISSRAFKSTITHGLRVRVVLGQAQVGSCYLAGTSKVILS